MRRGILAIIGLLLGSGIVTAQFPPVPPGGAAGFAPGGGLPSIPPMPGPGFNGIPGAGVSGIPGGNFSGIPGGGVTGLPGGFSGAAGRGFNGGIPGWETSKRCLSCGRGVPESAGVGQQCPHCGVTWNREIGPGASRSNPFSPNPPTGAGPPFTPNPPTGGAGNPFGPPTFTPNPGDPGLPPGTPLNPPTPAPNHNLPAPKLDHGNFFNFDAAETDMLDRDKDDDEGWSGGEIASIVGGVSLLGIALGVVLKLLANSSA